jgi:hypothetical protein
LLTHKFHIPFQEYSDWFYDQKSALLEQLKMEPEQAEDLKKSLEAITGCNFQYLDEFEKAVKGGQTLEQYADNLMKTICREIREFFWKGMPLLFGCWRHCFNINPLWQLWKIGLQFRT